MLARVRNRISQKEWSLTPARPGSKAVTITAQTVNASASLEIRAGDWVQWSESDQTLTLLTQNTLVTHQNGFFTQLHDPRRIHAVQTRKKVNAVIRQTLEALGYLEVETPLIVPSPGMEPHIRPLAISKPAEGDALAGYLPTSPEFAMKRLLAGGLERIFQISPAFRDEPRSPHHLMQFTMLEFYRALATDTDLMSDVENLISEIAMAIHGRPAFQFEGIAVNVQTPFPRYSPRQLFLEFLGVDLKDMTDEKFTALARSRGHSVFSNASTWDDVYFLLWLNEIEPRLPKDRAYFITEYPASQAALSVTTEDADGFPIARRFEVYAGGLELGNAFQELTDPIEQRRRFEKDMKLRAQVYGDAFPPSPMDESFLSALAEGIPPSSGIAIGVDRLIMLAAGESDIQFTHWL